jgi:CRP/FNR family cyclic AMP-dependent transcriptional regulator
MNPAAKVPAQLRELPLFREFTDQEIAGFVELTDLVSARAGTPIVRQDEPGDCMYILLDGTAKVIHRRAGQEVELHTMTAGDFFGELALFDQGPRSADVVAKSNCLLFKMPQSVFSSLAGIYPSAALKLFLAIAYVVVGRMRRTNAKYLDSLLPLSSGRDYSDFLND